MSTAHTLAYGIYVFGVAAATWAAPSQQVLWEETGELLSGETYQSSGRGFATGSSLTSIADPTGSGRGSVLQANLGGTTTGTEFASIEVEASPFEVANKVVYSGDIQPGTTRLTFSVDVYIPSAPSGGTVSAGDSIGFLIRTENNNSWFDNAGGEWGGSVNLSGADLTLVNQWQTLFTTVTVPVTAGGGLALNGLFPLVSLNDAAPAAASGVFAYVDNIKVQVQDPEASLTTDIQVNAGVHRFVGQTRKFDRARYLVYHGDAFVPQVQRALLSDPDEIYAYSARYAQAIDQIASRIFWPPPTGDPRIPESFPGSGLPDLGELDGSIDGGTRVSPEIPLNYPGYAAFVNRLFDNTTLNPSLTDTPLFPTRKERMIFEVMNEPNFSLEENIYLEQDIVDIHAEVPPLVRAAYPDILIGGPGFGGTGFRDFAGWELFKSVMDGAGDQLDFFSFHPYDRYNLFGSTFGRGIITSAGRVDANLDLIEAYSANTLGDRIRRLDPDGKYSRLQRLPQTATDVGSSGGHYRKDDGLYGPP